MPHHPAWGASDSFGVDDWPTFSGLGQYLDVIRNTMQTNTLRQKNSPIRHSPTTGEGWPPFHPIPIMSFSIDGTRNDCSDEFGNCSFPCFR